MMMIIIIMIIASYIMVMIIIILTASYIGDDVRIVYALAIYDAIFFDGGTNEQGDSRSRIWFWTL